MKKHIVRNTLPRNGQTIRFWMQMSFAALCIWIGVEFTLWHAWNAGTGDIPIQRPPGVEGFLPISAFMSFWYFLRSGDLNMIHPAGTVILIAIIAMSVAAKKSFCSWLCPVGTISESLGEFGRKIFGRQFLPWRWADYALRSLKYFMLAFLVYTVVFLMNSEDLRLFLESPYNRVADVKMFLFFKDITRTSIIVIAVLVALSLLVRNFWCRYLCPYGALLGVLGLFSPFRITRNASNCIDCAKCAKVCPAAIKVDVVRRVLSDECTSCMACVDACPVADTLQLKAYARSRFAFRTRSVAIAVAAIFLLLTGGAMLSGFWKSAIPDEEYTRRIRDIDNPVYQHQYGRAPSELPADATRTQGDLR